MHDYINNPLSEIFMAAFGLPKPEPKTEECDKAHRLAMRVLENPHENWV